jgi:AcrR family transcriptional regulator
MIRGMGTVSADRPAPRERLLAAADRLFYEEGVCTVGVDRILQEADVARASLYSTYGSKDELIRAYLQRRSDDWEAQVAEALPGWGTPRDRILGLFELLTESSATPGYNGCPFINASAEAVASDAVTEVRDRHRAKVRELFADLGREAGAKDPEALAQQLMILYDGSAVVAQLDRTAALGQAAVSAAAALVDESTQPSRRSRPVAKPGSRRRIG